MRMDLTNPESHGLRCIEKRVPGLEWKTTYNQVALKCRGVWIFDVYSIISKGKDSCKYKWRNLEQQQLFQMGKYERR